MERRERIKWIDCAKAIAIIAVVIDHCYGVLYTDIAIASSTYFSVSLFILLSGLAAQIASRNKEIKKMGYQLKKIARYFKDYAVATFVIYMIMFQTFDIGDYISYLLNFSISPPLYFFVFFFQIALISPYLLSWCRFCEKQKYNYLWHGVTVLIIGCLSSLCINYTYILPLHGGGKYLFGGTYLLIYYIGILFGAFQVFERKKILPVFIISLSGWLIWWKMRNLHMLPFDHFMQKYWGDGINPPSIELMVLAILSSFVCFSLFTLLERTGKIGTCVVNICGLLGKYTLYTFMYHWLIRDKLIEWFPNLLTYNICVKLLFFLIMVIGPVVVKLFVEKVIYLCQKRMENI